jgi:hypothetical protein
MTSSLPRRLASRNVVAPREHEATNRPRWVELLLNTAVVVLLVGPWAAAVCWVLISSLLDRL